MSIRNNSFRNGGEHYTDPTAARYNSRYHQRNGPRQYSPEPNRRSTGGDDVDSLITFINCGLTTDGNPSQDLSLRGRLPRHMRDGRPTRPTRSNPQPRNSQINQTGWWRVTIQQAGTIGKDLVMSTLKVHCPRQFQPYHYFIESNTKAGVFFINSQQDADMIKRANGKVEVRSLDILRIMVGRVPSPTPSLDPDTRPHFKDYLLNRRFDQQIFKLDLSNLADDEELSSLGIFPQFNKHAFIRDVVDIINKDLPMTRQLDLGSNNIMNLYEFRNLRLDHLVLLSVAANQLKNVEDFENLKQLPHLAHLFIQNNPLALSNNPLALRNKHPCIGPSHSSIIRQKLPQLKRIDNVELPPTIRFLTDIETTTLPPSVPHCVPHGMQSFLAKFIEEFYRLFDTDGRGELHTCYHDSCMFSLCITRVENSIVSTRQFKYGALIYESRNIQVVGDDNKRSMLLRHGKKAVLDFLRVKFPLTKHDGNSFHVDVISTADNRAVFTVNGLYTEIVQAAHRPVRCFQRTFTCAQTAAGVLIIADHIMLTNATDTQITNMTRPSTSTTSSSPPTTNNPSTNDDIQTQMTLKFSQESGMNIAYSQLCLQENNWNYEKAAAVFLDARQKNMIPAEAFNKS